MLSYFLGLIFLFFSSVFSAQQSSPLTRVSCTAHLTSSSFLHERATMTRDLEGSSTRNVGLVNPTWLDRPRDLKRPLATVSCCCCSNPLFFYTLKLHTYPPTPTSFSPPLFAAAAAAAVAPPSLDYISLGWAQLARSKFGWDFFLLWEQSRVGCSFLNSFYCANSLTWVHNQVITSFERQCIIHSRCIDPLADMLTLDNHVLFLGIKLLALFSMCLEIFRHIRNFNASQTWRWLIFHSPHLMLVTVNILLPYSVYLHYNFFFF